MLGQLLAKVQSGDDLDAQEAQACLDWVLENEFDDDAFAELLCALADKGETVDEILGFVNSLVSHSIRFDLPRKAIDVCGTGGSGLIRYNVSTTVAFVVAAGGVPVVKLSSRGSQQNGSLDFLEGLGCRTNLDARAVEEIFHQTQLCFLDASVSHPLGWKLVPALKKVLAKRRSIFRFLFALASPVQTEFQLVGTTDPRIAQRLAYALGAMNRRRALVVTGTPGIDELSVSGTSVVFEYRHGKVVQFYVSPSNLGITQVKYEQIPCGDCRDNVRIFLSLLQNEGPRPVLDMACLNAGAAFYCYGTVRSIKEGYFLSKMLFQEGRVRETFLRYKALCHV